MSRINLMLTWIENEQEKVKHLITCFNKALLNIFQMYMYTFFKCICTCFCTFVTTIFDCQQSFLICRKRYVKFWSVNSFFPPSLKCTGAVARFKKSNFSVTDRRICLKCWFKASDACPVWLSNWQPRTGLCMYMLNELLPYLILYACMINTANMQQKSDQSLDFGSKRDLFTQMIYYCYFLIGL